MGVEYELKFRTTPEVQKLVCQALSGEQTEYSMQTTYYDTVSGSLSQRKYTLRRRLENGVSVCTLKVPAQGNGRGEWEVQMENIGDAIPQLVTMGAPSQLPELTREGLVEVCGAKFHRIAKTLVFEDGVLELAFDLGMLTGGGKQMPLCEIEVELKEGPESLANNYAKCLASKYGLVQEHGSKFRRALALSKGEL